MGALAPSGYWQDLATTDFAGIDPLRTIALLPVSATEQHGPHLPLATDAAINRGFVQALLADPPAAARVLVLPAIEVGDSLEHTAFPGTLGGDLRALLGLWLSIGRSVARAGLRKLVIFNSHGGQRALVDQAAVRLRAECAMTVVRAHSYALGMPEGLFAADELAHGLHGGAMETSLMLHLRPELVRREHVADFVSHSRTLAARGGVLGIEKPIGIGWMAQDVNPAGVCGNAADASADKGALLLAHGTARLRALCDELAGWPLIPPGG